MPFLSSGNHAYDDETSNGKWILVREMEHGASAQPAVAEEERG